MVDKPESKNRKETQGQSDPQSTEPGPARRLRQRKPDWARLDYKLIILMNRILTKALKHGELDKTETTILLNYDKLRQVGNKPITGTKALTELSDTELELALGRKPEN